MSESSARFVYRTAEGGWRIAASRVSLDSVIHAFRHGHSAEDIVAAFPTLSVEQVLGALSHYHQNQHEFDAYFTEQRARWRQLEIQSGTSNLEILDRVLGV